MGRPTGRLGDMQSGHGCFPPTNSTRGSNNVMVNGRPALTVGSSYVPHCCPKQGCHPVTQARGSSSVRINGKPVARIGDKVGCGGSLIVGSGNVLTGG